MTIGLSENAPTSRVPHQMLGPDFSWVRITRLAMGIFLLAAVASNTWLSATGGKDTDLVQHFSLFTIQSNMLFGMALLVSAFVGRNRLPRWWDNLRGALAFYLIMTGIVYALLVAPPGEFWSWDITWTNLALHRVGPLFAIADWLLVTMTARARWGRPFAWLLFPLAYLMYSWVRGAFAGWYPYDFLNPTLPGGWGAALMMVVIVLLAFLAVGSLVHLLGNLRTRAAAFGRAEVDLPKNAVLEAETT